MILQKIVWGTEAPAGTEALYYHTGARLKAGEAGLQIPENTTVSFDTYFNAFLAEAWKRYTELRDVSFRISVSGAGNVMLMKRCRRNPEGKSTAAVRGAIRTAPERPAAEEKGRPAAEEKLTAEGENGHIRGRGTAAEEGAVCMAERRFSGRQEITFLLRNMDSALYYIALDAAEETLLEGGAVETDEPAREVRLALVTCTYRREAELLRNLRILKKENRKTGDGGAVLEKIFVVDNAKSLLPEQIEDERFRLIPNANTGGSGGFTRGLREAAGISGLTHIILMDDDVQIEFEAFRRTRSLLQYMKEEYSGNFIGGAMLRRDVPYLLYAAGEDWADGRIRNPYRNTDLRRTENILKAAEPVRGKQLYAGWWYCCVPKKHIGQRGYPMPFFLHCDDVEYSLRSGRPPLYLNGIGVWHEEFEDKRSSAAEYYDTRNRLITNAIYMEHGGLRNAVSVLCERFYATVFRYRYRDFALSLRAAEDFLKGPEWLYQADAEALHRAVLEEGYRPRDITAETDKLRGRQERKRDTFYSAQNCRGKIRTIVRYFFPAFGKAAVRMGAPVSAYAGKKRVLLTEPKSGTGFEVRKSWRETVECMGALLCSVPKLLSGCRRSGKMWRKQAAEEIREIRAGIGEKTNPEGRGNPDQKT